MVLYGFDLTEISKGPMEGCAYLKSYFWLVFLKKFMDGYDSPKESIDGYTFSKSLWRKRLHS